VYSTQFNTTQTPHLLDPSGVTRRHLLFPSKTGRIAEGGLRIKGLYKESTPHSPLVSIVTVVRNGANTVEQCILSVLKQSYQNIEYIVVDGASTDGTVDFIRKYDDAIDYYLSEADEGIYSAMNKGISLASGEYILILNSDDWYRQDAVALLVDAARTSGADVVHADANVVDARGKVRYRLKAWLHDGLYTRGLPLRHETMLTNRKVYERFGNYDKSYAVIADFPFVIALYEGNTRFQHLPEPILYFRWTGVSNTDHEKRERERRRLFHDLFPFLDDDDLDLMKGGNLKIEDRLALLTKHKDKSELFARSMAYNIADTPIRRDVEQTLRLINALKRSFVWPLTAPLRRIIRPLLKSR
jgi:glycosyltransferase involved in cell wall biosynthesis